MIVMITAEKLQELKSTGKWMVRFSNDGIGYNGFKWAPIGEWTDAPDWNTKPVCEGGLFGQNAAASGYCKPGSRFELCEIDQVIIVDNAKVKTNRAKIIAVDQDAFSVLHELGFCGSLDLDALPSSITSIGGSLDLRGYNHPLPSSITSIGGSLNLRGYNHPLPSSITSIGGSLNLRGYNHPLPSGLISVGGSLYLRDYNHPLPSSISK